MEGLGGGRCRLWTWGERLGTVESVWRTPCLDLMCVAGAWCGTAPKVLPAPAPHVSRSALGSRHLGTAFPSAPGSLGLSSLNAAALTSFSGGFLYRQCYLFISCRWRAALAHLCATGGLWLHCRGCYLIASSTWDQWKGQS